MYMPFWLCPPKPASRTSTGSASAPSVVPMMNSAATSTFNVFALLMSCPPAANLSNASRSKIGLKEGKAAATRRRADVTQHEVLTGQLKLGGSQQTQFFAH